MHLMPPLSHILAISVLLLSAHAVGAAKPLPVAFPANADGSEPIAVGRGLLYDGPVFEYDDAHKPAGLAFYAGRGCLSANLKGGMAPQFSFRTQHTGADQIGFVPRAHSIADWLQGLSINGTVPEVYGADWRAWISVIPHFGRADYGAQGLDLEIRGYPDPEGAYALLDLVLTNAGAEPVAIAWAGLEVDEKIHGRSQPLETELAAGATQVIPIIITSTTYRERHGAPKVDLERTRAFLPGLRAHAATHCVVQSPDPVLDAAYVFNVERCLQAPAGFRANNADSVLERAGLPEDALILPPGGPYWGGVWANDSVESPGPIAAYLAEPRFRRASINTQQIWVTHHDPERLASGDRTVTNQWFTRGVFGGRGDGMMVLYGTTSFLLADGDRERAAAWWPFVDGLARMMDARRHDTGVHGSVQDEGEGRWRTGPMTREEYGELPKEERHAKPLHMINANLSVNLLGYAGLRGAADLAEALGHKQRARELRAQREALGGAIRSFFEATVEGIEVYRYFEGNTEELYGWVVAPPAFDLFDRIDGVIAAAELMWDEDRGQVSGRPASWAKVTNYFLRGLFRAGHPDLGHRLLRDFCEQEVFQDVTAPRIYHDGDIFLESSLFVRNWFDGIFGITPTGFDRFELRPNMPSDWPEMSLTGITIGGKMLDIHVSRAGDDYRVVVSSDGTSHYQATAPAGSNHKVVLPN